MVIPVSDYRRHGIFHPICDAVRTQIVKQEDLGLKRYPICFTIACTECLAVSGSDALQ